MQFTNSRKKIFNSLFSTTFLTTLILILARPNLNVHSWTVQIKNSALKSCRWQKVIISSGSEALFFTFSDLGITASCVFEFVKAVAESRVSRMSRECGGRAKRCLEAVSPDCVTLHGSHSPCTLCCFRPHYVAYVKEGCERSTALCNLKHNRRKTLHLHAMHNIKDSIKQ